MNRSAALRLLVCLLLAVCAVRLWLHREINGLPVVCRPIGPITWEENWAEPRTGVLPELQTGDVLVTLSAHSLGWRHGHCALVLDGSATLEATTLGRPASVRRTEDWTRYPTLWLLRPKTPLTPAQRAALLDAAEALQPLPYALFAPKVLPAAGAHCAALVWYAYAMAGLDAAPEGGWLITPASLLRSDFFTAEQLQ